MAWMVLCTLMYGGAGVYALVARRRGKPRVVPMPAPNTLGLYELAYLAGGPARVADVAVLAAQARGSVLVGPDGQVVAGCGDPPDAFGAAVVVAGHAGPTRLDAVRVAVADAEPVRAVRARLFASGLVNPGPRNPTLMRAQLALVLAPFVGVTGLFFDDLAESPLDGTLVWVADLLLVLLGSAACVAASFLLFTSTDRGRSPLTNQGIHYLWQQVRDPAGLQAHETAVAGGHGLGRVALGGIAEIRDPGMRAAFGHAALDTRGRARADGWPEQQWIDNANERGPLLGPSYVDLYAQAMEDQQAQGPLPQGRVQPGSSPAAPSAQGPPGGRRFDARRVGPPPWERLPGVQDPYVDQYPERYAVREPAADPGGSAAEPPSGPADGAAGGAPA
ncbi:TIGR04222 domain-containing membrane protein [Yinghuangia seranimata]|uniref:TIGR04222 domain-containing membrane protein n=1 Tax=Yinghuangia seranimata TaxID=408067 RepID=UPI00248BCC5D|nr:TIGR04222 domain-containing membrane protein [Yinghuangia seranimata]MDI2131325.1 TIGR04222 domain-containing membrane protein [Yinghuangia seranimata]